MFKANNSDIIMTAIDTDLFSLFDISYPFLVWWLWTLFFLFEVMSSIVFEYWTIITHANKFTYWQNYIRNNLQSYIPALSLQYRLNSFNYVKVLGTVEQVQRRYGLFWKPFIMVRKATNSKLIFGENFFFKLYTYRIL